MIGKISSSVSPTMSNISPNILDEVFAALTQSATLAQSPTHRAQDIITESMLVQRRHRGIRGAIRTSSYPPQH